MFIFCIGCILQFILVEADEPTTPSLADLKPQEIIQMSLRHVHEMLTEIDDKIAKERKLLSQLEGHGQLNATDEGLPKLTGDSQIADIVREWVKYHPEMPISEAPMCQTTHKPYHRVLIKRQGAEVARVEPKAVNMGIPQDPSLDIPLDVEPEEIPGLPPGWPFNEEPTTAATLKYIGPTIPGKLSRIEQMRLYKHELKVGYVYASIVGINDLLVDKGAGDLGELFKPFGKKVVAMVDEGDFDMFGEPLVKRCKVLGIWLSLLSVEKIKEGAKEAQMNFKLHDAFPADIHDLLIVVDAMFEPVDGEKLFDVIEEMDRYSAANHGSKTAENLCQKLIDTILEPIKRKKGTVEMKKLITKANEAYSTRYPDFRRSEMFNVLDNFIEVENERYPNMRRRMSTGTRHIKARYKKIIRHLIKKHPTLLKYFAKHYQRNAKHKHHHSRKKHHTPHRKNHHSNKKQQIKRHERRKSVIGAMNPITHRTFEAKTPEMFAEANLEIPNFRERADQTTFMYPNRTQKRYSIVTEKTGGSKRISPSVLTRRFNVYNKSHHVKSNAIKNVPTRLEFSSTKTVQNNKVLKKIVGDSSYSDEEKYLRTMLYDAFFHGNDTITSNWTGRARVHHLGAEGSDTDEEWVFKSNIYKVFQQPII